MEFKRTKGNWRLKHSEKNTAWNIIGTELGSRYKIAILPYLIESALSENWNNKEKYEQKANALLISKAPEMLETIEELLKELSYHGYTHSKAINSAKQLIKEATEI